MHVGILMLYSLMAYCNAAGRNFVRGVLLGLMATFTGILIFSAPEYIQQIFRVQLGIPPALIVSCSSLPRAWLDS
jgi:hypothetical protein